MLSVALSTCVQMCDTSQTQVALVSSGVSPSVDNSAIVHPGDGAVGMPPLCTVKVQIELQVRI